MFVIFILGILRISASSARGPGDLRVYQGEYDSRNEFPFIVKYSAGYVYCSGSLIADHWILTAAHCFNDFLLSPTVTRHRQRTQAENNTNSSGKTIFFVHPNYDLHPPYLNDIALLYTGTVPNKTHAKLWALDYKTLIGLPVKYAGFGKTSKSINNKATGRRMAQRPAQIGEGVIVPCADETDGTLGFDSKLYIVCVSPKCSKRMQQARPGDSGGPLVYDGRVIGVGKSILLALPITSYTSVSPYLEWIQNTMRKNGD